MGKMFWQKRDPSGQENEHGPTVAVSENDALPVGIYWKREGGTDAEGVNEGAPLPVGVTGLAQVVGKTYSVAATIPGIAAADALDANDAMGTKFTMEVPKSGIIQSARFYDLDDEGISKELWLFRYDFTGTANDAAFSVAAADTANVEAVILFSTFRDGAASQVGTADALGISYIAPEGKFYCQVKTTGADNIAAGAMPRVALRILPDAE